jgi:sugar (glycoside-pentoside-hexuronide) transporter
METSPETKQADSVLGFKEKLAFLSVNVGNIPIMTMLSYYLLLFYIDVVGLDPISIGTLFLIARVLDGVSDPIMGYVIDHLPRTRMGRFRGYLILGVILCSLNFLMLWLGPSLANSGKLAIAYISYLLIGWTFDLMDIPLNSMIPVMSDRDRDRNTLSIIKGVGYLVGTVALIAGVLPLVNLFPTKREGFHTVVVGVTVLVALLSIMGTLGIKERVFPLRTERYGIRNVQEILGARAVLALFLSTLVTNIGTGVNAGTLVFFFLYVVKRPEFFSIVAASYILGVTVAAVTVSGLIRRFGKKTCQTYAMLITLASWVILFFTPASLPWMFVIIPVLASPATGMSSVLLYGIQADTMDYVEWKLGYRAEAAIASMNSFIVKAGSGIGSAIGAYLLAAFHYAANAEIQAAETIRGFYYINFAIPAVFSLIALLIWAIGYPLTKKMTEQMMSELKEIRLVIKS